MNSNALCTELMWTFTCHASHVDDCYNKSESSSLGVVRLKIIRSDLETGHHLGFIRITLSQNICFQHDSI